MIPSIEQIVEDLATGTITKAQAIGWLHQHAHDACRALRDDFAAAALQGILACPSGSQSAETARNNPNAAAQWSYEWADAMLAERGKP